MRSGGTVGSAGGSIGGAEGSMGGAAPTPEGVTGGAGVGVDALVKPWRVRLVDLPFSAVEWIVTEEDMHKVGGHGCVGMVGGECARGRRGEGGGGETVCLARWGISFAQQHVFNILWLVFQQVAHLRVRASSDVLQIGDETCQHTRMHQIANGAASHVDVCCCCFTG